ncbi:glycoside hydrolase family 16 protein [Lophiostoma macrostomum CBS 122681]|uniref:chitinase n=1 Tax=Lophiostoma macrostomum CBS 122681 TaxID=1314788 RepID=A0A6A6TRF3_9PLEO|nr:glycoside hydrolase family 16 protein [Lophiostoma macrostomum CBS 122681]
MTMAQTHTDCNPLNRTDCPSMEALGGNVTFNFNDTIDNAIWMQQNAGEMGQDDEDGAYFTILKSGQSPMVQSKFYMFFGRVSIIMQAANGTGIISSAILQSEDLDEIDWEFKGGKSNFVYSNYYGKGDNTTNDRGEDHQLDFAPQNGYHNYTIDWQKNQTRWYVDDKQVRELKFADAMGGKRYPQTPMNIRLGIWSGGDKSGNNQGTVDWAGGETDFSKAPFTMNVRQVYAHDYTSAKEYSWEGMDGSGDWEKVKVVAGTSDTLKDAESPHGIKDRYNALSKTAKIAIACSVLGFVVLCALGALFYFIRQRRAGRREFLAHQAAEQRENAELLEYKQQTGITGKPGYNRI